MSDHITLEVVDVDGAIQEADDDAGGDTRADFFRKAAIGGGALHRRRRPAERLPRASPAPRPSRRRTT